MSEELLPCPFCGGPASVEPLAKGCRVYAVLCVGRHDGTCMARQWGAWTRKKLAIAAWNRRSPDPLRDAVVEAARHIGTEHSGICATVACNCVGHAKRKKELAERIAELDAAESARRKP